MLRPLLCGVNDGGVFGGIRGGGGTTAVGMIPKHSLCKLNEAAQNLSTYEACLSFLFASESFRDLCYVSQMVL